VRGRLQRLLPALAKARLVIATAPDPAELEQARRDGAIVGRGKDGPWFIIRISYTDESGQWHSLIRNR
jgi:hypothetical protein